VAADDEHAKNGPAFDDDEEITREFEQRVYSHFGLELATTAETPGAYGAYYSDAQEEHTDLAAGERLQTGMAPPTGPATGATD
jgi:hypothetical protein